MALVWIKHTLKLNFLFTECQRPSDRVSSAVLNLIAQRPNYMVGDMTTFTCSFGGTISVNIIQGSLTFTVTCLANSTWSPDISTECNLRTSKATKSFIKFQTNFTPWSDFEKAHQK